MIPGIRSLRRLNDEASNVSPDTIPAHISALHDLGEQEVVDFLVMEFLEGETLQQRLLRGPLPPQQVLEFGIQIGEALDLAHQADIAHRDLKPGNIMLTKSGASCSISVLPSPCQRSELGLPFPVRSLLRHPV
jgi:eukaryotic-like serine/threonine-protein kinase